MRKRILALLLSMILAVTLIAPAWSSTLNALPEWPDEAVYGVFNLDKPHEVAQRIAGSFFFKALTLIEPVFEMAGWWLKEFPVVSASVAVGMGEEGFSLQGAIKFVDGKKDLLDRMAKGKGGEKDIDALFNNPVPGMVTLVPFEGNLYSVVADGMALVLATVEQDMLLIGFTPEDIDAARSALNFGEKRMKLDRRLPQGSFFYFHDNGMAASELQAESKGVLKDPEGNLIAELGWDASDYRYDFSVFTNFAKVFSLAADVPSDPLPMRDRVLMGGGKPWLALMGRTFLEKKHFDEMKEAAGEEYSMIMGMVKQFGFTEESILNMLKSVGMVFGGEASIFGAPMPGGYFYVSGEPGEINLLLPLMEMAVQESGLPFEPVTRPGWTALYAMRDPVDVMMGIKDGMVMVGVLNPDSMDSEPELSDRMRALYEDSSLNGFLHFDAKVLRNYALSLLDPEGIVAAFAEDDEDLVEVIPLFLEGLKASLEFRSLDITGSAMERADFTFITEDVNQEDVDAITALAEKWGELASDEDDDEEDEDED